MKVLSIGYKASAEQFAPGELRDLSVLAEGLGFDTVAVSDHFQPWRHAGGQAPAVLPWLGALGQATRDARLGTSVLTPTLRYNPAVVAQAFGTLGCLFPGRVFLGVGSGEAMNETPVTGGQWPGTAERRERLAEAVAVIRELWTSERVSFKGKYYETRRATIYNRPATPVPIYMAASGPRAATLAGEIGDGFICTSGKDPALYTTLLDAVSQGARNAGRDADSVRKMIEVKVSYHRSIVAARDACGWWAALALSQADKAGVEDPVEMEKLAEGVRDRAHTRFIVSDDPEEVVERIGAYVHLGFDELVIHGPDPDQRPFLARFAADVLPRLRHCFA